MLVHPDSSSAVLVMISINSVPICNRFYAKRVNGGKNKDFQGIYLSVLQFQFEENSFTQRYKICSQVN